MKKQLELDIEGQRESYIKRQEDEKILVKSVENLQREQEKITKLKLELEKDSHVLEQNLERLQVK